MDEFDLLERLENHPSLNDKILILKEGKNNNKLIDLLNLSLDFKAKFYISKWNTPAYVEHEVDLHDHFLDLTKKLSANKGRSSADVKMVEDFMALCSERQQKWYTRVLLKNLRNGVGITLAAKADIVIEEFEVQLAKDAKKCKIFDKIVKAGVFLSPKLDGYRCIAIVENGKATLYSRNGTEYTNFPTVVESVEALAAANGLDFVVWDGEIMSDDFNSMQQSAFASTRGTTVGDVVYNIFDEIPYDEWVTNDFKEVAMLRYRRLGTRFLKATPEMHVRLVQHIACNTTAEAYAYEKECIGKGFEGAMVNPNIPYYRGKPSNKMLKLKTFSSMECTVVSIYEGKDKYAGQLGGVSVIQENGNKCDVGSGFSDIERTAMFNDPTSIVGRIIEVKYQELTPDGVMRFPTFVRFRDGGPNQGKR